VHPSSSNNRSKALGTASNKAEASSKEALGAASNKAMEAGSQADGTENSRL